MLTIDTDCDRVDCILSEQVNGHSVTDSEHVSGDHVGTIVFHLHLVRALVARGCTDGDIITGWQH